MCMMLTGIQNGESISLAKTLSSSTSAELEVALCELTYYQEWFNISSVLGNTRVSSGRQILDRYYNVCELDEEVIQPFACTHWSITAVCEKRLVFNTVLSKLLGFARVEFDSSKI